MFIPGAASYPGQVSDSRWAQPRYSNRTDPPTDIDRFWTRHDRMTGANEDLTVFKSNLPGIHICNICLCKRYYCIVTFQFYFIYIYDCLRLR